MGAGKKSSRSRVTLLNGEAVNSFGYDYKLAGEPRQSPNAIDPTRPSIMKKKGMVKSSIAPQLQLPHHLVPSHAGPRQPLPPPQPSHHNLDS